MHGLISRYETEIRLGLLAIVVLLILLNISSNYILHNVKKKLTDQIDNQLASAMHLGGLYLANNNTDSIPPDQAKIIQSRTGIDNIFVTSLANLEINDDSRESSIDSRVPALNISGINRLKGGQQLFRFTQPDRKRLGLSLVDSGIGRKNVIIAGKDSWVLNAIISASEKALILAVAIVLLIVPLTIFLPRFILRPFRTMREQARSVGRLETSLDGDEVDEVIQSYEEIINELRRNEAELNRLYQDSSSKADRLEKFNLYILKSIKSGVVTVDLMGKVIRFNRAAGSVLKYTEAEVIDRHYLVAFPREEQLCLLIESGLERGKSTGYREIEIIRDETNRLWLGVESSLIYDDLKHPVGVTLLFTDLTEIKKLESELEINRRMAALGEMTGGLAHQLRNSLAAVSGFCQLMKKKTDDSLAMVDISESIRAEAAKSEVMVRRFLDFARPLQLNSETVNLVELIAGLVNKYSRAASDQNSIMQYTYGDKRVTIIADQLLLEEAIGNLIDNALKATGNKGKIEINLENIDKNVVLTIADNGPGIDEKIRDKIFTPFFSSRPSGTGLGLSLTQKIINLHEGRIYFEPDSKSGAVCRVILPLLTVRPEVQTLPAESDFKKW